MPVALVVAAPQSRESLNQWRDRWRNSEKRVIAKIPPNATVQSAFTHASNEFCLTYSLIATDDILHAPENANIGKFPNNFRPWLFSDFPRNNMVIDNGDQKLIFRPIEKLGKHRISDWLSERLLIVSDTNLDAVEDEDKFVLKFDANDEQKTDGRLWMNPLLLIVPLDSHQEKLDATLRFVQETNSVLHTEPLFEWGEFSRNVWNSLTEQLRTSEKNNRNRNRTIVERSIWGESANLYAWKEFLGLDVLGGKFICESRQTLWVKPKSLSKEGDFLSQLWTDTLQQRIVEDEETDIKLTAQLPECLPAEPYSVVPNKESRLLAEFKKSHQVNAIRELDNTRDFEHDGMLLIDHLLNTICQRHLQIRSPFLVPFPKFTSAGGFAGAYRELLSKLNRMFQETYHGCYVDLIRSRPRGIARLFEALLESTSKQPYDAPFEVALKFGWWNEWLRFVIESETNRSFTFIPEAKHDFVLAVSRLGQAGLGNTIRAGAHRLHAPNHISFH